MIINRAGASRNEFHFLFASRNESIDKRPVSRDLNPNLLHVWKYVLRFSITRSQGGRCEIEMSRGKKI